MTTTDIHKAAKRSRHDQILDSAVLHLTNFGLGTATLPEIAACMGITRSALYYYAKSKEDLVYQTYKRSCDILAEEAEAAASLAGSAPDRLETFITQVTSRPNTDIIAFNELGVLSGEQQAVVLAQYQRTVDALSTVIRTGMANGEFRQFDARIAAHAIVSIVQYLTLLNRWAESGSASGAPAMSNRPAGLVAGIVDLLLNGWATDRSRVVRLDLIDLTPLYELPQRAFDRDGLARAKRAEILTTSSRMFNRRGVSSTTLDEIAAELGATKRTLYNYVGDKQAILSACHARARSVTLYLYDQYSAALAAGKDPLDAHVNHVRSAVLAVCDPQLEPLRVAVGLPEILSTEPEEYLEFARYVTEQWYSAHGALRSAGLLRMSDPDILGFAHLGSINWLAKGLVQIDPSERVQVVSDVIDLLRLGLKPIK